MVRPEFVKKALDEIRKRTANYEYFFNHLKSPDWIEPLFNEGLFQHPPEPHSGRRLHLFSFLAGVSLPCTHGLYFA